MVANVEAGHIGRAPAPGHDRLCIVGVGASAGGLEAIKEMLSAARPESDLAYVLVQHLDPTHESLLAELIGRQTELDVSQAVDGVRVERGKVYIIPPGHGLSISQGVLHLTDFEQPRGLRRPIDEFFESLAVDQGRFAACVILSGTGADGSAGLRAIKENGGLCVVQRPETARYDGMPVSAQATGLVDFLRAPDEIVDSIVQFYQHTALLHEDTTVSRTIEESLDDICRAVRQNAGHDFSGYKRSTLVRRVERRISVLDLQDAAAYLRRLRDDPEECELLFRELLINVTRFFRDGTPFDKLRREVVEPLLRDPEREEIRVWVPGCSSGEEAYSLAMLLSDAKREIGSAARLQVFATDIDEQMLKIARSGVYPLASLVDIPEGMRDAYTLGREGKFQITSAIRDLVRFSVHSVVRDPPFSNIDLISCRNLLIYFGDDLQELALPVFHYALRPGGTLFLGPSETVGRHEKDFPAIDQSARIFRRAEGRSRFPPLLDGRSDTEREARDRRRRALDSSRGERSETPATDRLLQGYAPASVQVAPSGEILASTGRLSKYLDHDSAHPSSSHIHTVARPGLREAIRPAMHQVSETGRRAIARDLRVVSEFGRQHLDLIVERLPDQTLLMVFRDRDRFEALDEDELDEVNPADSHVENLEEELRDTRARLHTTVEELETANEELKSSNEEMMSMNEELQSTNEELSTVNDELKVKVDELSVANADLNNFFASTALPLVVLDYDLGIRNFTEAIDEIFPVRGQDRGRPLTDITSHLRDPRNVIDAARRAVNDGAHSALEVQSETGTRSWSLAVTPYRTRTGETDGATLVFTEITEALELRDALTQEGERLQLALDVAGLGVWELDTTHDTLSLDAGSRALLQMRRDGDSVAPGALSERIIEEDRPAFEAELADLRGPAGRMDVTVRVQTRELIHRAVRLMGSRASTSRGDRHLGVLLDVTDAQEAMQIRETMLREMNHRVKNMFSIIAGIVRTAARTAPDVASFSESVERRISALARSHELSQRPAGQGELTLHDAVRTALEPYEESSPVEIDGPPVPVDGRAVSPLSLIFHELATNSAKYGVMGPRDGRLRITWSQEGDTVTVDWLELYAEAVPPDAETKRGFGTRLIEVSAMQLDGHVEIEADAERRLTRLTYQAEPDADP